MSTYDVTIYGPDGNPTPLAADMGYWQAYSVAYHYAYTTPQKIRCDVAIVERESGKRQFTFAAGGRRDG